MFLPILPEYIIAHVCSVRQSPLAVVIMSIVFPFTTFTWRLLQGPGQYRPEAKVNQLSTIRSPAVPGIGGSLDTVDRSKTGPFGRAHAAGKAPGPGQYLSTDYGKTKTPEPGFGSATREKITKVVRQYALLDACFSAGIGGCACRVLSIGSDSALTVLMGFEVSRGACIVIVIVFFAVEHCLFKLVAPSPLQKQMDPFMKPTPTGEFSPGPGQYEVEGFDRIQAADSNLQSTLRRTLSSASGGARPSTPKSPTSPGNVPMTAKSAKSSPFSFAGTQQTGYESVRTAATSGTAIRYASSRTVSSHY